MLRHLGLAPHGSGDSADKDEEEGEEEDEEEEAEEEAAQRLKVLMELVESKGGSRDMVRPVRCPRPPRRRASHARRATDPRRPPRARGGRAPPESAGSFGRGRRE